MTFLLCSIFLGRTPTYIIADLEILKEVMVKSFDNFRNRVIFSVPYPLNLALFFLEDNAWKRVRNTISPSFTGVKLRRMCGAINDCARTLTTNFAKVMGKDAGVNMKQYFGAFSMDVICQTAFGIKVDSQTDFNHPFVVHAKTLFQPTKLAVVSSALSDAVPALGPVFNKLGLGLFPQKSVAFFETITGNSTREEPNYGNIGKLKYLDNVITETLRLYPPAFVIDRTVSEPTQIKGLTFSKGQDIFIPVMAIHRNPELYDDPDSFKPERFEDQDKTVAFQAFGFGPRACIGMRLALVEVKVALVNVLRAVKFDRMPDTPEVLTFAQNPTILQPDKDIILKVSPRC
ncbi:cytochrome P450 3A28-like [Haliotis rubra]|uniref:cytochrome P450 3A28-like n=1 Tax=Haliotis rubra TaxID=36100 RepID=UPI001EE517AE|nr:cytochrome P450 3A28-like [Haliotis rubra]